jgi:hypothetical protein
VSAADHADDLDGVTCFQCHCFVRSAFDDRAVVLDSDRAWVDAEMLQVTEKWSRAFELDPFAVDLERDHLNIPIAA